MDDLSRLFKRAADLHRKGNLAVAERLYLRLLRAQSKHSDALHCLGILRSQQGRFTEALASYDKALAIKPRAADVLNNRGSALRSLNRPSEALASYDKALAINPDAAFALNNRGNALQDLNRTAEALASFDKALAIKPDYVEALNNRGNALQVLKRPVEALASYDRALKIRPDFAEAWVGRGSILNNHLNRYDDALAAYDNALAMEPDHAIAWFDRGGVLQALQRPEEAIVAYRQALAKGGDAEVIRYTLAGLGAEVAPVAAPKKFVTELFDQCADRFDEQLVNRLKYRAPDLLLDLVARFAPSGNLDVLDLGCGTGLVGARLHPLARTLTGVDISPNMLEMARQRQIYDNLVCGELIEFLQTQTANFDLAVAADVFLYIGDLSAVFDGARGALRDGGLFGFSVEASEEQDFVLRPTLRYAQSAAYLRRLADDHGFILEAIESQVIRQQDGIDVSGYLALLRRRNQSEWKAS